MVGGREQTEGRVSWSVIGNGSETPTTRRGEWKGIRIGEEAGDGARGRRQGLDSS